MNEVTGLAGAPSRESAQPNRIAIISTCSTSPVENAPTKVSGMIRIRKSAVPELLT